VTRALILGGGGNVVMAWQKAEVYTPLSQAATFGFPGIWPAMARGEIEADPRVLD
jgi:hypothetical protein